MSIILAPITGGVRCGYSSTGPTKFFFLNHLSFEGGMKTKTARGEGGVRSKV